MIAHWHIFTDANAEKAARQTAVRCFERLSCAASIVSIEPYQKGGHRVHAETALQSSSWPEAVVQALTMAQTLGYDWTVTGSIRDEIDLWSTRATIAGVKAIQILASKEV